MGKCFFWAMTFIAGLVLLDAAEGVKSEQEKIDAPTLETIVVYSQAAASEVPPMKEKYQLPQTSQSITEDQIQERVNMMDTEDAIKYFPSLFVRKRNNGDTQPVLATRTWGVGSSARSLVYADDVLLSALIANNNSIGAPRWGMVSPEEIDRIDFLYGPFSAAYPGNSMGGVLQITTKMPEKFTFDLHQAESFQTFNQYATKETYETDQTSLLVGDKQGNISWLLTENFQNSDSQPLNYVTSGTTPAGTTGIFPGQNKLGAVANVAGAGGLLHTEMNNVGGKISWEIAPEVKMTYQGHYWYNETHSEVQTYLKDGAGNPTYGNLSGFASSTSLLNQQQMMNSLSVKTESKDSLDWDVSASNYYYINDLQRSPYGVSATGTSFSKNGNMARMNGTNWTNGDIKGIWRPTEAMGSHEVSFGFHADRYDLDNPTFGTNDWNGGGTSGPRLYTYGKGTTTTEALWVQDAWHFAPDFKLTPGGRLEFWQAFEGYNLSTKQNATGSITSTTSQNQPEADATRFSPKMALGWTPSKEWEVTGSFGQGYRFPTVTELYQVVSTGTTFAIPNAGLKPENVLSEEIAVERKFSDGHLRLSFFNENVKDALISQTSFISGATPVSYVNNVDEVRNTGVELAGEKENVLFHGLTLFGSGTYVDSEIVRDRSFASTTGTTAKGKRSPNVPDWRSTFGATYHPTESWALTAAGRYSGKQYSTLDNTDTVSQIYGAFDQFFVVDLRAQYQWNENVTVAAGIDNAFNNEYFIFHPFPQRTFTAEVKIKF
ncbi:MAG: TonB-dependent receptor [Verrucomicrobiota bacterium]